ncbi:MAG: THUMP domain-containing protein [Candidatus Hodarchaeota archaeon]
MSMTFKFNILVSTPRNFERDAIAELDFLVHQIFPQEQFNYGRTIVKGLIWGNIVEVEPILAVREIKSFVERENFELQYLLKFVPIQEVLINDLDKIEEYILSQLDNIKPDEKFKMIVKKRRTHLKTIEIIEKLTKNIESTVDLDNPDKIIRVEIIGRYAGVSFLEKGDVFSIGKKIF